MSLEKTSVSPEDTILNQLLTADQLDRLYLSLNSLIDMVEEGDIDLILDQPKKSHNQKILYLQKITHNVCSPELHDFLVKELEKAKKSEDYEFFSQRNLHPFLVNLQKEAEAIRVVKLTFALEFKEKDLQEMAELLANKINQPVVLDLKIDHSIIGGAVIQLGNFISDYSLKTRLSQFRSHWKAAVVEEKEKS